MNQISLLLENQDVQAVDGVTFDRLNPITGEVATRASAAQIADARRAADAAAAAFPAWSSTGPGPAPEDIAQGRRPTRSQERAQFIELMATETGATAGWAGVQCRSCGRHAARSRRDDDADFRRGHSVRQAGLHRDGGPAAGRRRAQHRALERTGDSRRARRGDAARMRQYRGAQGLGDLPGHAPPDRANVCAMRDCRPASSTSSPTPRKMRQHLIEALIAHPAVRRINFTGSTRVGRIIAQTAAQISQAGTARTRRQGAADRARRR